VTAPQEVFRLGKKKNSVSAENLTSISQASTHYTDGAVANPQWEEKERKWRKL